MIFNYRLLGYYRITLVVSLTVILTIFISSDSTSRGFSHESDFCNNWEVYKRDQIKKYGRLYDPCYNGDCDIPRNRNESIPEPDDPYLYIRLYFNIFCEDDGSNCGTTESILDLQIRELNSAFSPSRIQFVYDHTFINSTEYRYNPDVEQMKSIYARAPEYQLNVYITEGAGSFGTYPWDDVRLPLSDQGGIVIRHDRIYPAPYYDNTLAHEIGHCLGLWHTFHGVFEVPECGDCYEMANGEDADVTGDLCSDTPPTPRNYDCRDPGGVDPCCDTPWGETSPQNYMSYSALGGTPCWTEFTPQQWGRMHCWIDAVLSGWIQSAGSQLSIAMIPDENPIEVMPGEQFGLTGILTNNGDSSETADVWIMLIAPEIGEHGPLHTFHDISLQPGQTINAHLNQQVPINAPLGIYDYIANAGDFPDTIYDADTFQFTVFQNSEQGDFSDHNRRWVLRGGFDRSVSNLKSLQNVRNYPNPFNSFTEISFQLIDDSYIEITVFDILGRRVAALAKGNYNAGAHNIRWDASNQPSGIYFYRLSTPNEAETNRITLIR